MSIQLIPLIHKYVDGTCLRSCKIIGLNGKNNTSEVTLWFQFDESISPPNYDNCDAYLLAVLHDAMRQNTDIEVKGHVSKQLLANITEYQEARARWYPDIYTKVNIYADDPMDDIVPVPGALCAFSGGVDSTFSLWRHVKRECGYRSQNINMCVMVHGFDIPIGDELAFKKSYEKSLNVLNDVDIPLVAVKTNYREVLHNNWEHSYCCALVAAMSNFKRLAGTCIVGSEKPYDYLVIPPMGSSPVLDHLLSSGEFSVVHDGASHNRTEKVKAISGWKVALQNLRVCWQGERKDQNCGVCEKCVRTRLNFLAAGSPVPTSFPDTDIIEDMRNITLKSHSLRLEWQQLYDYAKKNNVNAPWVDEIQTIIKKPAVDRLFPKGSRRRKMAKDLVRLYRYERDGVNQWLSE